MTDHYALRYTRKTFDCVDRRDVTVVSERRRATAVSMYRCCQHTVDIWVADFSLGYEDVAMDLVQVLNAGHMVLDALKK